MKIISALIVVILATATLVAADNCPRGCTREWRPVCARLRRLGRRDIDCTFGNHCTLRARQCSMRNERWTLVRRGACDKPSIECGKIMG